MKTIIHMILVTSLCLLGTQALATNYNNGWNNSYKKYSNKHYGNQKKNQYNFKWSQNNHWNKKQSWRNASKGNGWHHGGSWNGRQTHAVPELDSNVAPLAGLLLSGLLAAGFERRRRKQLKRLEN